MLGIVLGVEGQHVMCMSVLGADGRVMLLLDDGYVLYRLGEEKAHGRQEMDPSAVKTVPWNELSLSRLNLLYVST